MSLPRSEEFFGYGSIEVAHDVECREASASRPLGHRDGRLADRTGRLRPRHRRLGRRRTRPHPHHHHVTDLVPRTHPDWIIAHGATASRYAERGRSRSPSRDATAARRRSTGASAPTAAALSLRSSSGLAPRLPPSGDCQTTRRPARTRAATPGSRHDCPRSDRDPRRLELGRQREDETGERSNESPYRHEPAEDESQDPRAAQHPHGNQPATGLTQRARSIDRCKVRRLRRVVRAHRLEGCT